MRKTFKHDIEFAQGSQGTTLNEIVRFEDYDKIESFCWVGEHNNACSIEVRKHDGKEVFSHMVPLSYYKQGAGREEFQLDQEISANSVRIVTEYEGTAKVKGSLIFTLSK